MKKKNVCAKWDCRRLKAKGQKYCSRSCAPHGNLKDPPGPRVLAEMTFPEETDADGLPNAERKLKRKFL